MDRPEHERALHELMYGYAHKKYGYGRILP